MVEHTLWLIQLSPQAPARAIIQSATRAPGMSRTTSRKSQMSRWYVIWPCSLKVSRVITGSWKWSGDGTEMGVPGIDRDGEAGTESDN